MINEDDDTNGLDAADGNLDPKFMSFGEGENPSKNFDEQPLDDSYNDDQLSSFNPSPLELVS